MSKTNKKKPKPSDPMLRELREIKNLLVVLLIKLGADSKRNR